LTRECFFCGGILIDMIDNDIEKNDRIEAVAVEDAEDDSQIKDKKIDKQGSKI
jgi:hypothetical protein